MTSGSNRIVAIDVRPQRIGFAAFESAARILDAGTRKMKSPDLIAKRIACLIAEFHPSVLILRRIPPTSTRHRPRTRMIQRLIRHLAHRSGIAVVLIGERELQDCFQRNARLKKHEIATLLAKQYPEIAWKLPEKRKIYDREAWSMVVFDATALGIAYLASGHQIKV